MKKLFTFMLMAMAALMVSCGDDYDDSALVGRVDDLEDRVEELEKLCREMNTNISSLQSIVTALQGNDYITGVSPITEGGETIGYTISFAKGESITIYHGQDGKDGQDGEDGVSPVLGVKQHTDGLYYWTINGEWVKDAEGNMIKAEGQDGKDGSNGTNGEDGKDGTNGTNGENGKDGITPELKVENGLLFVSYDEGATWEELGSAVSEEMYIFKSVEEYDNYVVFTLYDGTELVVAKYFDLVVSFNEQDLAPMAANSSRDIRYTVESAAEAIEIEVLSSLDLEAEIIADDASQKVGVVRVKSGAELSTTSKVVLLVSDGQKVVMKSIVFEQPGLRVEENTTKEVAMAGGDITLEFFTNMEYEVIIPEEAASWLTLAPETRAMEKKTITLNATMNTTTETRSATVTVQATDSELKAEYFISQNGVIKATVEEFLAAEVDADVWYQLTGVVQTIASTTYGNFDLVDETGSIYVYGLTATKVASNDESFSSLGIDAWDTVTLIGTRADFKGTAQVGGPAFYVSHEKGEEPEIEVPEGCTLAKINFADKGYTNAQVVADETITVDENVSLVFGQGGANNPPAWYDTYSAIRMYQNGATLEISAPGKTIITIELTFTNNMYYVAADSGELTEEAAVRTWTGEAEKVKFTCTGTDSSHRAYVASIKIIYKGAAEETKTTVADCYTVGEYTLEATVVGNTNSNYEYIIVADETGFIPVSTSDFDNFAIGDKVTIVGETVSNEDLPARFDWGTEITKIGTETFTLPEPTVVTEPSSFFSNLETYPYVSLTGSLIVEESWSGGMNYLLTVDGSDLELAASDEMGALLNEKNGQEVTLFCIPLEISWSGAPYLVPIAMDETAEPEPEPKTTVADCYTIGTYTLDRVQVVAVNNSYMMLADESGAIYATRASDYNTYETVELGDWVKISGTTVDNGLFPAKLTYMVEAHILENTECTYPEAQEVTNLDEFAAAPNYNYSKVTGTVIDEDFYGMKKYYIAIDGQTAKVNFEYPLTEWTTLLAENVGKSVVATGYFHGLSSGNLNFTPTSIEAAAAVGGEPINADFMAITGKATVDGMNYSVTLTDAESNELVLYIDMTQYCMDQGMWQAYPYIPTGNLYVSEQLDDFIYDDTYGIFVDQAKSKITYNGKEYTFENYDTEEFSYGALKFESQYQDPSYGSDENTLSGTLKATDGSMFKVAYTGTLYK
uniref:PL29 family lyase N-terminal domain-containing protein n=1 Tax=Alistipes sp. TaxID=1872444 RepID=UPI0040563609